MRAKTAALVDIGLAHLGRFAFFTRDNPFLSSTAALDLPASQRRAIADLLEQAISPRDWLSSAQGQRLLGRIRIGCVPRDVQLVSSSGGPTVGVESVHAFVHAPLFWWLVSILWTISVGRRLDSVVDGRVTGYRLATRFVQRPAHHSVMFRPDRSSYAKWKGFPSTQAAGYPGETLAATTVDLRDFYYSVVAPPSRIVAAFASAAGEEIEMPAHAAVLTDLLDALHGEYAARFRAAQPRGPVEDGALPLPVGPPSSRILANLVMFLVADDLVANPDVIDAATYADDVVLLSRTLPEVRETTPEYLERLAIASSSSAALRAPSVASLALLKLGLEKSSTVLVRAEAGDGDAEPPPDEPEPLDPYIEGDPSPEWGGGLRTILRAPYKRDRVPRKLVHDIRRLVDEIRVGLDRTEAQTRVRAIIDSLDNAHFLAVRPYWADLLVAAITVLGPSAVPSLSYQFEELARSLEPPEEASPQAVEALNFGLRASWIHALGLAVSVSLGHAEREALRADAPQLITGGPIGDLTSDPVVAYARRLRARRLIDPAFVAVPLAEFSEWTGPLIGESAASEFLEWSSVQATGKAHQELTKNLARAVRFVALHEACLAVHIWAGPRDNDWLERVFELLSSQPLVADEALGELQALAGDALQPVAARVPELEEERAQLILRIAMPSMPVSADQLRVLMEDDRATHGNIVRDARSATMHVVLTAIKRKADLLVLPEWTVPLEVVPWLMERAANSQLLIVAGQAPTVRDGTYSNAIWVGIPLRDSDARRACLVPPPREKGYLSPEERSRLDTAGLARLPSGGPVPVYQWRGFTFASLICFEFADIATRQWLHDSADVLTVSSLNRDWRYFDAIQEATTRDNYCLTVCVNTGAYPGTRIMRPTTSAKALAASVHGSEDATIVTRVIDLTPIVAASPDRA